MTYRAVLFDMDGVLVDSYEAWFGLIRQATLDFGLPEASREAFAATWGQGIDGDVATFFPGKSYAEVDGYYHDHFATFADRVEVLDGSVAVFEQLRRRGVKTAVATNTPAPLARVTLDGVGVKPDQLVTASDVDKPKPAPDMLLLALDRLRLGKGDVLFVGDSRYDAQAAANAGVRFVGYQREGDLRIEKLSEVAALIA